MFLSGIHSKVMVLAGALVSLTASAFAGDHYYPADAPAFDYSDYIRMEYIESPAAKEQKAVRFNRVFTSANGYDADNPGARIRFITNSPTITVHLYYNDKHSSKSARNAVGTWYIDGVTRDDRIFSTKETAIVRKPEFVDVKLDAPADQKEHLYEIVAPYADSMDFLGVTIAEGAELKKPAARSGKTCLFIGDSITGGFTASSVTKTYAFQVAQANNWRMLNMGLAGSPSKDLMGMLFTNLKFDVVVIMLGVNDWQGGANPKGYAERIKNIYGNLREYGKETPLYFITPLWVPDRWKPKNAIEPLDAYRTALQKTLEKITDEHLHIIDGLKLMDHDDALVDRVAVHPNDAGFAQIAVRLTDAISKK